MYLAALFTLDRRDNTWNQGCSDGMSKCQRNIDESVIFPAYDSQESILLDFFMPLRRNNLSNHGIFDHSAQVIYRRT